jgi:hypothetical protein
MALLGISLWCACTKQGDFIDEGRVGDGVHYYPVILNNDWTDTLSGKRLNKRDTVFSAGQKIAFELDYFSEDTIKSLQVWGGESAQSLEKILDIPFDSSLYSVTKQVDTVLFEFTLPKPKDTLAEWHIQARVTTIRSLDASQQTDIYIR